jgi:chromosomal replication initiation ATPase DnaA
MTAQYVLPLPKRPAALGAVDFLVAESNREAVQWLDRWPDWPAPALTILGPGGSGKTHLLRVFLQRSAAVEIASTNLSDATVAAALGAHSEAAMDDAERAEPVALLHLFNLVAERRGHLLLTASAPPAQWARTPPDLASRLAAAPQALLQPPDDALLAALLLKLFADRQFRVESEVVLYCIRHMERSHEMAMKLVSALERINSRTRRPITIAMVREALGELQGA